MADGLARQIAGLTGDIRNLGKRIPSYQRGVVANVSPPTVIMDRDVTATPRPVADVLVPGLAVGQRVEVRVIGSRRVITSIRPADNGIYADTGWVPITSFQNGFSARPGYVPAVRVKGGVTHVSGELYRNSMPSSLTAAFDLPEWAGSPRTAISVITNTAWDARVLVQDNGTVFVSANTPRSSSTGYYIGGLTWPVD